MLHTIIKENSYQDSIVLMLLTNQLAKIDGVLNVSVMMGTKANQDILKTGGLYTEELEKASPNDMVVVMDLTSEELIQQIIKEMDIFLEAQAQGKTAETGPQAVKTWDKALEEAPTDSVVVLSIPGTHAALEIERAIDEGKHVFCFSDNVPLEEEVRLKKKAHETGVLLMGPDCGTGIINGIPVAFTNKIRKGNIGVVGASGTGIQEVTTLIHKLGAGVTQAIGTGGRDLQAAVGGITLKDSILLLEQDLNTDVIVVISKPPAKEVRDEVLDLLRSCTKPAVTIFLGESPVDHEENLYRAYTLEEAAQLAVQLVRHQPIQTEIQETEVPHVEFSDKQTALKGFYSGGTLAYEAAMLVRDTMKLEKDQPHEEGYILKNGEHEIIDLGDDIYTQGKPHPMIDPSKRIELLKKVGEDTSTAVVLLDIVLGYGSHSNMAAELAPIIQTVKYQREEMGDDLVVVATVVGTDEDPQNIEEQTGILEEAGVLVYTSNAQAVRAALEILGYPVEVKVRSIQPAVAIDNKMVPLPPKMLELLSTSNFINIGLRSFGEVLRQQGGQVVQFDWHPVAGGNLTLQRALRFLEKVSLER